MCMGSNKSVEMSYSTQKPFQKNFDSVRGAGEGSVALGKVGLREVITNHEIERIQRYRNL